jgi:hypothetical protein
MATNHLRAAVSLMALLAVTAGSVAGRERGEEAVVVLRVRGCDYFLADGAKGYFLLEWYGGHDPVRGDDLFGEIGSYGFKDVYYVSAKKRGRVYVDDYLLSRSRAIEKLADKCD